jgi:hypothetical protein
MWGGLLQDTVSPLGDMVHFPIALPNFISFLNIAEHKQNLGTREVPDHLQDLLECSSRELSREQTGILFGFHPTALLILTPAGGLLVPEGLYSPIAKYFGTCFNIRIRIKVNFINSSQNEGLSPSA